MTPDRFGELVRCPQWRLTLVGEPLQALLNLRPLLFRILESGFEQQSSTARGLAALAEHAEEEGNAVDAYMFRDLNGDFTRIPSCGRDRPCQISCGRQGRDPFHARIRISCPPYKAWDQSLPFLTRASAWSLSARRDIAILSGRQRLVQEPGIRLAIPQTDPTSNNRVRFRTHCIYGNITTSETNDRVSPSLVRTGTTLLPGGREFRVHEVEKTTAIGHEGKPELTIANPRGAAAIAVCVRCKLSRSVARQIARGTSRRESGAVRRTGAAAPFRESAGERSRKGCREISRSTKRYRSCQSGHTRILRTMPPRTRPVGGPEKRIRRA